MTEREGSKGLIVTQVVQKTCKKVHNSLFVELGDNLSRKGANNTSTRIKYPDTRSPKGEAILLIKIGN